MAILGLVYFHINVGIVFSISVNIGYFDGKAVILDTKQNYIWHSIITDELVNLNKI
jgi:hypothetical protein